MKCPNSSHCDHLNRLGYMPLYHCFCAIRNAFPEWTAPKEHNPKTIGMALPKDDAELSAWAQAQAESPHGLR